MTVMKSGMIVCAEANKTSVHMFTWDRLVVRNIQSEVRNLDFSKGILYYDKLIF
jgi:hypothetical protein